MVSPAEDIIASLISEDEAKLYKERLILKARLKDIDKVLKPRDGELKREMDAADVKSIEAHNIKITYTPKRKYKDFVDRGMVIRFLEERGRNDLIKEKSGYDRLTITKINGE